MFIVPCQLCLRVYAGVRKIGRGGLIIADKPGQRGGDGLRILNKPGQGEGWFENFKQTRTRGGDGLRILNKLGQGEGWFDNFRQT